MNLAETPNDNPENPENNPGEKTPPKDLDTCPRCGSFVGKIIWGHTNCPSCGLHFECC
jgi:hypothetical protein